MIEDNRSVVVGEKKIIKKLRIKVSLILVFYCKLSKFINYLQKTINKII